MVLVEPNDCDPTNTRYLHDNRTIPCSKAIFNDFNVSERDK